MHGASLSSLLSGLEDGGEGGWLDTLVLWTASPVGSPCTKSNLENFPMIALQIFSSNTVNRIAAAGGPNFWFREKINEIDIIYPK